MKRWIALVLVLVMAVGALPMAALATTNTPLGTYEWMEEQYGTEAATKWKWLLNNYNAKYADVYDLLCNGDSDEAESFYYACTPEAVEKRNSSPYNTKVYTQEELIRERIEGMSYHQLEQYRVAYCYLTSNDPDAVTTFRNWLPYTHPGYSGDSVKAVYTEAEMKAKYGDRPQASGNGCWTTLCMASDMLTSIAGIATRRELPPPPASGPCTARTAQTFTMSMHIRRQWRN